LAYLSTDATLGAAGNAGQVLKVFYLGPIREQLNTATVLLSKLDREEGTQDVYGKSFTVPLHVGRNNSAGVGVAENGTLPDAGAQGYHTATVPNKYVYGRLQVTGQIIKATKNSAGSFIKAIDSEVKGLTRDMKKAVNRQLHSDGTDALAYYLSGSGGTSGTVDDGTGNPFVHIPAGGIGLDLYDVSSTTSLTVLGTANTTVTLGAKAATNYAITTSANIGAGASTAGVGSAGQDAWVISGTLGKQMMGIAGIIANTNNATPTLGSGGLHGISAATYSWWNAQVFDNSATKRALSLELLQDPLSEIHVQSDYSESDVKFLLSNVWLRDKYVALCQSMRRIVNEMELDGGFSGVEFNGKPWVVDSQCKRNRVYYIVPETMKIFRNADFDWMDMDGAVLSRVANKDAYEAVLYHYGDLACVTRNANGLLADIID
jgi:hypothetical protein